jgi:hypothetical protein
MMRSQGARRQIPKRFVLGKHDAYRVPTLVQQLRLVTEVYAASGSLIGRIPGRKENNVRHSDTEATKREGALKYRAYDGVGM